MMRRAYIVLGLVILLASQVQAQQTTGNAHRSYLPVVMLDAGAQTLDLVDVTYSVNGAATQAYIGYTNATGKIIDILAAIPWSITIRAPASAELYVDAIASEITEQDALISCAITINGSSVFRGEQLPSDQDTSANGGVSCDRAVP